jgi:hypothetical protein
MTDRQAAAKDRARAQAENIKPLPPPKTYPRLSDLASDIHAAIDRHTGELPLASVIGVLEIVKARLIEENAP